MQYEINGITAMLDMPRFEQVLGDADPASLVDIDPRTSAVRISTLLDAASIRALLAQCGADPMRADVQALPSICCGGCSG